MKYLEREFYRGRWYFGYQSSATIKNWFKVKDTAFRGIKHVTKRHFRSIVKSKSYQFGGDYKILKNRSYMRKTRHRIYNRIEAVWNSLARILGGRR